MLSGNEERRRSIRMRILKSASIVFNNGASTVTCVVRNMSEGGARLGVEDGRSVPKAFTLQFSDGHAIDCLLAWRIDKLVGVAFARVGR